ncbi:hypothetical protein [Limnoglobus roseus]|uniref:Chromosome partition protein Smc n=1 Tax=Limnoglobus roseus TaxID=2598579 RepID=A0A5C1AKT3_9BACT|nr:hypothetical protein [Limnoglobus roseus]QEL17478.1 hypothetical protein PX52LOC_04467 [Limnoglobus roseus]
MKLPPVINSEAGLLRAELARLFDEPAESPPDAAAVLSYWKRRFRILQDQARSLAAVRQEFASFQEATERGAADARRLQAELHQSQVQLQNHAAAAENFQATIDQLRSHNDALQATVASLNAEVRARESVHHLQDVLGNREREHLAVIRQQQDALANAHQQLELVRRSRAWRLAHRLRTLLRPA